MSQSFNMERAAEVLLEAAISGDAQAAKKYGVSPRSLDNWRKRLNTDPIFSEFFQGKKALRDQAWGDKLPAAYNAILQFLEESAKAASNTDPESIKAMTLALKTLSEIRLTERVLDARLNRPPIEEIREVAPPGPGQGEAPASEVQEFSGLYLPGET